MANPNIYNAYAIYGKNTKTLLTNTSANVILNNNFSSNIIMRVNAILVANYDGTNNADISIYHYNSTNGGGTGFPIAHTITVPADSTLIVVDRNTPIYVMEGESLTASASVANDLCVNLYYDEIY